MSRVEVLECQQRFGLYTQYIGVATKYGYGVFTSEEKIKEYITDQIYFYKSFSRPNRAENYALLKLIKLNHGIYCNIPKLDRINEFKYITIKPFSISIK